ncbi:MAG: FprA family A-type flavoprotein [Thermoleophilia bacterium]|nr:FprA family A-type flavoprotein [Thermoleophilia bacterium]
MGAVKMAEGIWWVGAIDWELRGFHGLATPEGSTYNSYLVVGDKVALIDAVKTDAGATLLRNVSEIVDPARIDYVISNHSEPDHSGALAQVLEAAPDARLLASKEGVKRLGDMFPSQWEIEAVGDGDRISLGNLSLHFINTPLLHWPETMMTWCPERGVLFSCDPYGAHIATTERFADEVGIDYVLAYTRTYFAYLIAAYRSAMKKAASKTASLDIKMIAPSHGPIWRDGLKLLLEEYRRWIELELEDRATIIYGSMWGGTRKMAEAIAEGLKDGGLDVRAFNVELADPSDVIAESFLSRVVLIGSPTFESGVYPPVEAFIPWLRIPRDKSRQVAVFGSFGWSGGAARRLQDILRSEGYRVNDEPLTIRFFPDADAVGHCREYGRRIAEWSQGERGEEAKTAAE